MLSNIVNIILYLYSSTTIFFALNSSLRRSLELTPALRGAKPLLSTLYPQSPHRLPLKRKIYKLCSSFFVDFTYFLLLVMFWKQPTVEILAPCREMLTSEGTRWALKLGAVHLIFPPNAVSEPTSIVVYRWKSSVCSPPLQEHEAIVSNVIEISSRDGQRLKFSAMVTLSLSHSAPDLRGYEVVIIRQINKDTNEWEDMSGTKNLRCRQGIEIFSL